MYPNLLNRLKRVEILHCLKLQFLFFEVSLMVWCNNIKPFDFPTGISGFARVKQPHCWGMMRSGALLLMQL